MNKKYDLVVVGAGAAGLMAAKTAAENGLSVALLERKTDIPKIRRVDGGGIGVHEYLFNQMVIFNSSAKRLCFPVAGFSLSYRGPFSNIYGIQIHSPGGVRILFGDWEEARQKKDEVRVGILLSKEALLRGLLDECRHYGVEVFPGTNVTDIKKIETTVTVTGNGKTLEGTFVIAADGVNSRLARILGFNKERRFLGTQNTVTWILEGEIPIDPGSLNFIIAQKGVFSVMPTCDEGIFHMSSFSSHPKVDLNSNLESFMNTDKTYASWFANTKKVDVLSCVVNRLSPIQEPFRDNILLIGDAAWIQEISNMAALCSGWKAAHTVTLAIVDKKINREGLQSYFEWWEKYFYGPYGRYDFGMGGGELQDFLSGEEIDYLASLVKEPQPPTMNFFIFSQLGKIYGKFLPRIREERPALMQKLIEMQSIMKEKMEEQIKAGFPNR
jgi:flavin-dependent dehydrogenase